jgi:hypothetical protein
MFCSEQRPTGFGSNLTLISHSFSLTEAERDSHLGALIQFGFFGSAGLFSILAGPIIEVIDREVIDRSKLVAVLASFSSILACCSALVPTGRAGFFYSFLIRVSSGISVGMMQPAAFSLLGDLVAVNKRTTMGAFVTTSCACGAAIGQAIAGLIGPGAFLTSYLELYPQLHVSSVSPFHSIRARQDSNAPSRRYPKTWKLTPARESRLDPIFRGIHDCHGRPQLVKVPHSFGKGHQKIGIRSVVPGMHSLVLNCDLPRGLSPAVLHVN